MAKQIINLVATTELEAVNAMLASIGEAPIDQPTLDAGGQADVATGINILRNTTREIQSMGWRFNTEFGLELPSSGSYSRTNTLGVTEVLNVFTPPVGLIAFETTQSSDQQGSRYTDAVLRPSKEFDTVNKPMLFYDRALNRDGWAAPRTYLYIDAVWLFDFESLPETCRNYIIVMSCRRAAQKILGSAELSSFNQQDEIRALRNLKRDQGENDDNSIFDNMDSNIFGQRDAGPSGVMDSRNTPGGAALGQFDPFQFS